MADTKQPTLHKPKSKLRLRLGLTPPNPKPAKAQPPAMPVAPVNKPAPTQGKKPANQVERITSLKKPLQAQSPRSGNQASSSSPPAHKQTQQQQQQQQPPQQQRDSQRLQVSPAASSPLTSLPDTNSQRASMQSRPDSRSAFTYDNSPSTNSHVGHTGHTRAFDAISYTTTSPNSGAGDSFDIYNRSPASLATDNLTPGPSDPDYSYDDFDNINKYYPGIAAAVAASDDIFQITDDQLSSRFSFDEELGFGNWGSVWLAKPRHARASALAMAGGRWSKEHMLIKKLGRAAAASSGSGAGGRVAIKLVHREKTPTTAARVRALWGEMKIIRSLRHEPHPSIINFEAFVITPSYALVIMPCLYTLIPVCLPPYVAGPYFRQLASAVGYLHERGITHNDIKPANVMLSHYDIPVLVDFGFANQWDLKGRGSFLSTISWGTPEYLDPQRAMGMPHDERASDVWSLGVTMYEILIGRTPFEEHEEEAFEDEEDLLVYYERSRQGIWLGEWEMPNDMQHLLRLMICPDPAYRISAMQAYHHPALLPPAPDVIVTPHFIRAAAFFDESEPLPTPPHEHQALHNDDHLEGDHEEKETTKRGHGLPPLSGTALAAAAALSAAKDKDAAEKKSKKKKKRVPPAGRAATPTATTALGESIKQHTSVPNLRAVGTTTAGEGEKPVKNGKGEKRTLVISKGVMEGENTEEKEEEDHTPTKVTKPAQPLRIKEIAAIAEKTIPRTSQSRDSDLTRPNSVASQRESTIKPATKTEKSTQPVLNTKPSIRELRTTASSGRLQTKYESGQSLNHRTSTLSLTSDASHHNHKVSGVVTKEEVILKTMKSLEGLSSKDKDKKEKRDVLGKITRPAPEPPRPNSLDSGLENGVVSKDEGRRSLGVGRVLGVVEEGDSLEYAPRPSVEITTRITSGEARISVDIPVGALGSPPRKRLANPPLDKTGSPARTASICFPRSPASNRSGKKTPGNAGAGHARTHSILTKSFVLVNADDHSDDSSDEDDLNSKVLRPRGKVNVDMDVKANAQGGNVAARKSMAELREEIVKQDQEIAVRFRTMSGDVMGLGSMESLMPETKQGGEEKNQMPDSPTRSTVRSSSSLNYHRASTPMGDEALALDSRLDKISEWVKSVEKIVEDARKALAEGREPPLPNLGNMPPEFTPILAAGLSSITSPPPITASTTPGAPIGTTSSIQPKPSLDFTQLQQAQGQEEEEKSTINTKRYGLSPDRRPRAATASELSSTARRSISISKAIPGHLRSESTQVEPATPPKWMTYAQAEESIKQANAWIEEQAKSKAAAGGVASGSGSASDIGHGSGSGEVKRMSGLGKKERPSVNHVLKLFGAEQLKSREELNEKAAHRASTPEPNMHVPLKAPALRGAPSTPALRSSLNTTKKTMIPNQRKSESNLRHYNTLPTLVSLNDIDAMASGSGEDVSPPGSPRSPGMNRGRLYERFLDSTPGVVRDGNGWGSLSSGKVLAKPSSMASLRERARHILGGTDRERNIVDLAAKTNRQSSDMSTVQGLGQGGNGGAPVISKRSSIARLGRPATPSSNTLLNSKENKDPAGAGAAGSKEKGTNSKGKGIWAGIFGRKKE